MFGDGDRDGDKILSLKVGGAGMGSAPFLIYIYNIIISMALWLIFHLYVFRIWFVYEIFDFK